MDNEYDFTFFVKIGKYFSPVRYGESMFIMHIISAKVASKKSLLLRLLLFSSISLASWLFLLYLSQASRTNSYSLLISASIFSNKHNKHGPEALSVDVNDQDHSKGS